MAQQAAAPRHAQLPEPTCRHGSQCMCSRRASAMAAAIAMTGRRFRPALPARRGDLVLEIAATEKDITRRSPRTIATNITARAAAILKRSDTAHSPRATRCCASSSRTWGDRPLCDAWTPNEHQRADRLSRNDGARAIALLRKNSDVAKPPVARAAPARDGREQLERGHLSVL